MPFQCLLLQLQVIESLLKRRKWNLLAHKPGNARMNSASSTARLGRTHVIISVNPTPLNSAVLCV